MSWSSTESNTRGLSPRVRGSRGRLPTATTGLGSIPACAGEPGYDGATGLINQVYPRVCGGAASVPNWHDDAGIGSIPACAGEP